MPNAPDLIPEQVFTPELLDALSGSLQKHAAAHRASQVHSTSELLSSEHLLRALKQGRRLSSPPLFNSFFDQLYKLPRPFYNLPIKKVAAYHFWAVTGIFAACTLPLFLTQALQLSIITTTSLLLVSALLTWAYIKISRLITQSNAVVFFNYLITLMAGQFLLLRILNQPTLQYMDVMIIGAGLLFSFGRIGCFMAGCCYGKPSLWGGYYCTHHKKNGFPNGWLGVRLWPTQLVESFWLFTITGVSVLLIYTDSRPGTAFATFLFLLALGRFMFEFFRGDSIRPYRHGLSYTQWTALFMLVVLLVLQATDSLSIQDGQPFILASFLILFIAYAISLRGQWLHSLYSAKHIHEIADIFAIFQKGNLIPVSTRRAVHLRTTTQHIQLSENKIPIQDHRSLHHITLSSSNPHLTYGQALRLSRYVASLSKMVGILTLLPDGQNVYHLICYTADKDL